MRTATLAALQELVDRHDEHEAVAHDEEVAAEALEALTSAYEEIVADDRGAQQLTARDEEQIIFESLARAGFELDAGDLASVSIPAEEIRQRPSCATRGAVDAAKEELGKILPRILARRYQREAADYSAMTGTEVEPQPVLLGGPQGHLGSGIMKRIRRRALGERSFDAPDRDDTLRRVVEAFGGTYEGGRVRWERTAFDDVDSDPDLLSD